MTTHSPALMLPYGDLGQTKGQRRDEDHTAGYQMGGQTIWGTGQKSGRTGGSQLPNFWDGS